jgi:hypothetical protein
MQRDRSWADFREELVNVRRAQAAASSSAPMDVGSLNAKGSGKKGKHTGGGGKSGGKKAGGRHRCGKMGHYANKCDQKKEAGALEEEGGGEPDANGDEAPYEEYGLYLSATEVACRKAGEGADLNGVEAVRRSRLASTVVPR